jgi:DNA invertase Pin-like site-specific DNA recombinase
VIPPDHPDSPRVLALNQAFDVFRLFRCIIPVHYYTMIYGYARDSTDGENVDIQVRRLRMAGARVVFHDDTWADSTTPHGRFMLTIIVGLVEFERELIRVRASEGRSRAKVRGVKLGRRPKAHQPAEVRGDRPPRRRRSHSRHRSQLQCQSQHDFEALTRRCLTVMAPRV